MNVKLKSGLILVSTLILGMILGSVITGSILRNRVFDRMDALRTERGFVDRIERIIQPDENQREKVNQILSRHFNRMEKIGAEMHKNFTALNDSLIQDLSEVLRPDQLEHFKSRMERMRKFGPPRGRPDHRKHMRDRDTDKDGSI
jgi:hypothetical protein